MRFAHSDEWLQWLEGLHPKAIDLGLERVSRVWRQMGLDLRPARVITVAGTNGKGSSVAFLEAIYTAAGYRVCAYTSPHLQHYHERIRLEGQPVADAALCQAFERVDRARGATSLSYFEFGTLAALDLFARQAPDLILLEVGLGGRLDAVNIIDADLALISSIDFDHQAWLGDDIDQIAREKAGILRRGRPAVFNGENPPLGLTQRASELGVHLHRVGADYQATKTGAGWRWSCNARTYEDLPEPGLRGQHQMGNAAAVLMAVELMQEQLPVSREAVEQGLRKAFVPGRFQRIAGAVDIYLDVAHNPQGARALADALAQLPGEGRIHAVFGLLADKDAQQVVQPMLPWVDCWYLGRPMTERARDPLTLSDLLREQGARQVCVFDRVTDAFIAAQQSAREGERILVFGSFFTVSDVLNLL